MEKKKNEKANIDSFQTRSMRVLIGLGVALPVVLAMSEYISVDEKTNINLTEDEEVEDEKVYNFQPPPPPPPPPPQQTPPPQIDEIVEVEDDEEIEEVDLNIQEPDEEIQLFDPPVEEEEAPPEKVEILDVAQVSPEFPGGEEKLYEFLGDNLKYPPLARDANIEGRVFVQFVVWKDGSIRDVKILKGVGSGCDEEAKRVVNLMPKWNPGEQMGKKVAVRYMLPINFTLN